MTLYRKILKQAVAIAWRYKYLWFFGLFASLVGNAVEYEALSQILSGGAPRNFFPNLQRIIETGVFSGKTLANIGKIMSEDPFSLFALLAVGLLTLILFAYLIWLAVVSQAALINSSADIMAGKSRKTMNIQSGVASGMKNFWPVLGLNILIKAIIFIIFSLLSLPVVLAAGRIGAATANFIYLILFLILVPLALGFALMVKYSMAYVVIRGSGFLESVKQGWRLFIKNWLVSLEMAIILFFINLFAGLALSLVILTLATPFALLAIFSFKLASIFVFWLVAVTAFIAILTLIVLTGSALAVFQISSWTGLFIELVGKGGTSKITRLMNQIIK